MSDPVGRSGDLATSDDALLGGRLNRSPALEGPSRRQRRHSAGGRRAGRGRRPPRRRRRRRRRGRAGDPAALGRASADLVERDADLAGARARKCRAATAWRASARLVRRHLRRAHDRRAAGLIDGAADLVVTNPPFFEARSVRASPDGRTRERSCLRQTGGDAERPLLETWIVACLALLRAGGRFVMIHRPDALAQILGAFGRRLGGGRDSAGSSERADAPAHRILVSGVKGARGPISLRPGLVLHEPTGAFTPLAEAIHRGEALIDWGERSAGPERNNRGAALTGAAGLTRVRAPSSTPEPPPPMPRCPPLPNSRRLARSDALVPGADPDAAELLGAAGLRHSAALRHGSRRRHVPSRHDAALARAERRGRPPMSSLRAARRTGAMAKTPIASSIITSSR